MAEEVGIGGEAVRSWFERQGGTDYNQARTMVNAVDYWPRADKLLIKAFKLAERLVTKDRYAIETLARELHQHERLSVEEIRPTVLGATGKGSCSAHGSNIAWLHSQ